MIYLACTAVCFIECIINALIDAHTIKRNEHPNHPVNGFVYAIFVVGSCLLAKNWMLGLSLLAMRAIVFDAALNAFRGERIDYRPHTQGSVKLSWENLESVIDNIENMIFGKFAWYFSNAIYLGLYIGSWIYMTPK